MNSVASTAMKTALLYFGFRIANPYPPVVATTRPTMVVPPTVQRVLRKYWPKLTFVHASAKFSQ